jgi:asparagine synthase (glutamine-hydrolysing)
MCGICGNLQRRYRRRFHCGDKCEVACGVFYDFVRSILDAPRARQRGLFNRAYIERLLANPEGELTPKGYSKLWQVALLACWLQVQEV